MTEPIVRVEGLCKSFGKVRALRDVDLTVEAGTVFGLLGPNGAGKTTAIKVLTTLLRPDAGFATIAGYDVTRDSDAVRAIIGLAGQSAAVDENLTGAENLELVGRLYHLGGKEAKRRAKQTLEQFELDFAAARLAKTYSGGMRRRLDLAASLVGHPRVLFLDEPTAGLDPRSRLGLWDIISDLVEDGTTVLLTTQYLEEADRLADEIAVIDEGRVIATGTATELKSRVGGDFLDLTVADRDSITRAAELLESLCIGDIEVDPQSGRLVATIESGGKRLPEAIRILDNSNIEIANIAMRQPTLDDVFLILTGHGAKDTIRRGEAPIVKDFSEKIDGNAC